MNEKKKWQKKKNKQTNLFRIIKQSEEEKKISHVHCNFSGVSAFVSVEIFSIDSAKNAAP